MRNEHPVWFMLHKQCDFTRNRQIWVYKGRYGYTTERQVAISPVKYFNAGFLHYSGRFAKNIKYLIFAQFIIERKKVFESINVAAKKVHYQSVTAFQLRANPRRLTNLICQDQGNIYFWGKYQEHQHSGKNSCTRYLQWLNNLAFQHGL